MKINLLLLYLILSISSPFAKEYRIAFPIQDFYPQYKVNAREQKGILVEIIKKFAQDNSITLKIESFPVSRYVSMFKRGDIDFILPDNPDWGGATPEDKITYSQPIMKSEVIFFSKGLIQESKITSIATIKGYTIDHFGSRIENGSITVIPIHTVDSLIKFLEKGRADVGYFHKDIILRYIKENPETKIVLLDKFPSTSFNYHLSSIKHPEMIKQFDKWFKLNRKWIATRQKVFVSQLY